MLRTTQSRWPTLYRYPNVWLDPDCTACVVLHSMLPAARSTFVFSSRAASPSEEPEATAAGMLSNVPSYSLSFGGTERNTG